ncbi:MAG: AI-2E family transporter [Beijerinckiaceae bacterium]|nr:AI-2E family transporter [Beijerinckiaceae bacterium]
MVQAHERLTGIGPAAMRMEVKVGFWIGALALLILMLWLLSGILLPFAAAFALGYLLDPIADRLQRAGLNRLGATILILVVFVLTFVLLLVVLLPILGNQVAGFLENLPRYVARLRALLAEQGGGFFTRVVGPLAERFGLDSNIAASDLQGSVSDVVAEGAKWLGGVLKSLWTGGQALIGLFSLLVITPVVAFYILLDWDKMVRSVDSWTPLDHRETVRELAREIDAALSGFLRGQSLVCLFLGIWYGLGLTLIGLNFGLLIGIISGFISFIPYVGSLTGLILAAGVAIVQGWPDLWLVGLVLLVIGTGQFLEGNILTPKLVGDSVGLHPVWLMLALLAFGSLFGFTGLILAVPIAAAIGVLMRFGLRNYLKSPLYLGKRAKGAGPAELGRMAPQQSLAPPRDERETG